VCIRRNTQRGDAIWTEAHSGWMYPDDEASDVAVFDLPTDPTVVPPTVVPVKLFATDEVFQAHGFGLGDKVVAIGLFKKREGRSQNLPIVRSGILSGMPDEPLEDPRSGLPYSAYLIEIRSIGGLSGSPVVIGIEGPAELPSGEIVGVSRARFRLLGLIRGHWDVTSYQGADFFDREVESFNSGIALVTPCTEILPILEREDVVRERRRHNRKSSYARTR
jgi:hypothetical protein